MQLRHRLSIYLVTIFSIVILGASGIIYFSFYQWTLNAEIRSLEDKTLLAALYYLEEDEISRYEHETIKDKLRQTIFKKNIAIYNAENQIVKGEMIDEDVISTQMLDQIRADKKLDFKSKHYFYNGIFYKDNEGNFVVVVRENKDDFNAQLNSLLQILFLVCIGGIAVIYIFSIILGKFAYTPIVAVVEQLKEKDAENFHTPVFIKKSYAEINDLVNSYNLLIAELTQMFTVQKNFTDYVSHELRTPITALLGTLEVTLPNAVSKDDVQTEINKLKQYVEDLENTLDTMLLLSGAKTNFEFKNTHVDELIWNVVENATLYHQAQINVSIIVENADYLIIHANGQLLETAFSNLVENALKYSDNKPIEIVLKVIENRLHIEISDNGIGILAEDLEHIKHNFVRGKNTKNYQGKGIGLSMATIIFKLHKIEMDIQSNENGTTILLKF